MRHFRRFSHAWICTLVLLALSARANADVFLSINLAFNNPTDPTSGGTWTIVGKTTDQFGISSLNVFVENVSFNEATGFLAPPAFTNPPDGIAEHAVAGGVHNFLIGNAGVFNPPYIGLGVIGSASTYVDPAGIIAYGSNPSFGSFTGGAALATGTFGASVPKWSTAGVNDANAWSSASGYPVIPRSPSLTVRFVPVPESALIPVLGVGGVAAGVLSRRAMRRNKLTGSAPSDG